MTKDDAKVDAASRKRSRTQEASADENELEIDLNLPEPPSKKAKRLAKKAEKSGKKTSTDVPTTEGKADNGVHHSRSALVNNGETADQDGLPKKRSDWAIWIGNLEFSVSKDNLRAFFTAKGQIDAASITRINMPAPAKQESARPGVKRLHRGFAYVDFADEESMNKAIGLSEEPFAGRKVLIKNAKSFVGRPDPKTTAETTKGKSKNPPNRRVWVGNLAYDASTEDLRKHFEQAGEVEDVSLMTWEDTGRCKGFGFVRFTELDAAEAAVRGFIFKEQEKGDASDDDDDDNEAVKPQEKDDEKAFARKTKKKPRKWFINRLFGRQLDVQFAEDSSSRYKKRFAQNDTQVEADLG